MPTVSVDKEEFYKALGKNYSTQEFDELCFQFGIELDDDTTDQVKKDGKGERPTLKIDIPANRYDLLCHEGISRALLVFLGKIEQPIMRAAPPKDGKGLSLKIHQETSQVRPYACAAVLRNITFTPESYAHFIDLQDKLHQNLGRRRTLVAIGTHDLDKMTVPSDGVLSYTAKEPSSIKFVPLNQSKEFNAKELMEFYQSDKHLSKYLPIIKDSEVYPVMEDEKGVLSMPPIINSERTKIDTETKNVFIDMTAMDKTKMDAALNIICAMFAEYCAEKFTVEPVTIVPPTGTTYQTPDLSPRGTTARVSYINSCTGLSLTSTEVVSLLSKMGHQASDSTNQDPDVVEVLIPPTRSDVLHECDLMEDAAVAFGFDNLPRRFPRTNTVAVPLGINKLGDVFRKEAAYAGWLEALPLILCSHDENFSFLRLKDDGTTAVVLENPKTAEYQVVRTSLLPGLLKTIRENKKHSLPIQIFEVSDVSLKDEVADPQRGARNERRASGIYCNKKANFENVHGLLDQWMKKLNLQRIMKEGKESGKENVKGYYLVEKNLQMYFPGRSAEIYYRPGKRSETENHNQQDQQAPTNAPPTEPISSNPPPSNENESKSSINPLNSVKSALAEALPYLSNLRNGGKDVKIGHIGVLHPEVLQKFEIDYPCSAVEFCIEPFL